MARIYIYSLGSEVPKQVFALLCPAFIINVYHGERQDSQGCVLPCRGDYSQGLLLGLEARVQRGCAALLEA